MNDSLQESYYSSLTQSCEVENRVLYSLHGYSNVNSGQGLITTAPQRTSLFEMGLNSMASHFLSYPFHYSCAVLEESVF